MEGKGTENKVSTKQKNSVKLFQKNRKRNEKISVEALNKKILEISENSPIDTSQIRSFYDLPISNKTLKGLKNAGYINPTEIQREALGLALTGHDIIGAAKTGSGKTLAFLIPLLELLHRNEWTKWDRLGAVIISPTRELASQTFEVLRKIGSYHSLSAALVIGKFNWKFERNRLRDCNIMICTPGRLLEHMDKNPLFDCTNLKMLVLDEADELLTNTADSDMGDTFEIDLGYIIEHLPKERQTLLFSATQTKKVKDLARLSLKNPVYVSAHENAAYSTPDNLVQSYIVCKLEDKLNFLWSFIKGHLKKKILVFMATQKQVKYVSEALRRLRSGIGVLSIYKDMNQEKRLNVYAEFCSRQHVVLIATNVFARGLDVPGINWIIQMDCPENPKMYTHRVGRAARNGEYGEALLVLLPSEEKMVTYLKEKCIPITQIKLNPRKQLNVQKKLEILLAQHVELKEKAQRAMMAYMDWVFRSKDKTVFDFDQIDTETYARSLGLVNAPKVNFSEESRLSKSLDHEKENSDLDSDAISEDENVSKHLLQSKSTKDSYNFGLNQDSDEDDLLILKRKHPVAQDDNSKTNVNGNEEIHMSNKQKKLLAKPVTKVAVAKKILRKKIKPNIKIQFDEDGQAIEDIPKRQVSELSKSHECESGIDIEMAKKILREEDKVDKEIYRKITRAARMAKKIKMKEKMRRKRQEEDGEGSIEGDEEAINDDWSSGDENSVDLDFLPDPDVIYKNNESDNDDEGPGTSSNVKTNSDRFQVKHNSDDDEEDIPKLSKKRRKSALSSLSKKSKTTKEKIQSVCSELSLKDSESLALQLLGFN